MLSLLWHCTFGRVGLLVLHIKVIQWLKEGDTSLEGAKRKLEAGRLSSLLKRLHHFICGNETRAVHTWVTQDSSWTLLITGDGQNSVWDQKRDEAILTLSPDYGKKRALLVLMSSFLSQNVEKITWELCPGPPKGHKFRVGGDSGRQWMPTMKWLLAARWAVPESRMDGNKGFTLWFKSTISSWGRNCQKKVQIRPSHTHTHTHTHNGKEKRGRRKKLENYIRHPD